MLEGKEDYGEDLINKSKRCVHCADLVSHTEAEKKNKNLSPVSTDQIALAILGLLCVLGDFAKTWQTPPASSTRYV